MPRLALRRMVAALRASERADTSAAKGRALEEFVCALFDRVPGIELIERNPLNAFETEELDIALWNGQARAGLPFLPNLLIVECKNWNGPIGSQEVAYFVSRMQQRDCDHGILVAANGVTGNAQDLTTAHFHLATGLAARRRVLVFTLDELRRLRTSEELAVAVKRKLCQLVVSGTFIAAPKIHDQAPRRRAR